MHVHSAVAVYIAVEIDLFSKGFIAAEAQYTHRRSLPAVTGSIDKRSFCVKLFCALRLDDLSIRLYYYAWRGRRSTIH